MKLTGNRCRCQGCGEFFNSSCVFDRHRAGPFGTLRHPGSRRCLSVAEMGAKGWLRSRAGFWITAKRPATAATSRAEAAIVEGPPLVAAPSLRVTTDAIIEGHPTLPRHAPRKFSDWPDMTPSSPAVSREAS